MQRLEYMSGGFLFLLSVVLLIHSTSLTFWDDMGPAEGFFPFLLSIVLGLLSLAIVLRALLHVRKMRQKQEGIRFLGPRKGKFFLYLASFVVFGLFFAKIGYSLMVAGFLIFILKIVEKQSWKMAVTMTVGVIIASYIVFRFFLSVPLPEGVLSTFIEGLK
jgi:putative tricarboxylic transport membrane protein